MGGGGEGERTDVRHVLAHKLDLCLHAPKPIEIYF